RAADAASCRRAATHRPTVFAQSRRLHPMKHYLGIDIGTFESKGVLVDENGEIVVSAARPHEMLVPQPGWAEHRPKEDWWDDVTYITQKLLAERKVAAPWIKAGGCGGIGPCMGPVDASGEPLMNAVLY